MMLNKRFVFLMIVVLILLIPFNCSIFIDKTADEFEDESTGPENQNSTIRIDSTGNVGLYTSITVNGLNLYISYYDTSNGDLKFGRSTDGGAAWSAGNIKTVDTGENVGVYTSIAVDGTNIYIAYHDTTNSALKFAKSTDSGATWPAANIKTIESADFTGYYPSIVVNGPNIYISYHDNTNGDLKIAKSTDSGASWPAGNIKIVDSGGSVGQMSSIKVNGANVLISYYDDSNNALKFAKSTDSGATWPAGNIKTVDTSLGGLAGGCRTSIAVDGSNIYISYFDYANRDLKLARSTDNGANWLPANINIVDTAGSVGYYPSIAINGTNIYISYYDFNNSALKIAKSTDSGVTWPAGNIKTVDSAGDVGLYTSIAVDGANVYISYLDDTNGDLKLAKSTDSGATW